MGGGRGVLSTYDGELRDQLWWPQERPVLMRVARGPLRIPLRRRRGLRSCVDLVPETEHSSPVETGMSGNFLSYSKGVKDPLDVPDVRCD